MFNFKCSILNFKLLINTPPFVKTVLVLFIAVFNLTESRADMRRFLY